MERRKSLKTAVLNGPISSPARSDLLHHIDAISLALKNWNDTEALKLLRLHWREIAAAIHEPHLLKGIPVAVAHQDTSQSADDQSSSFDGAIDRSALSGGRIPSAPLRTSS
jgi:hypothetical protein